MIVGVCDWRYRVGEVYGALYARLSAAVAGAVKKARSRVFSFNKQLASAGDAAQVQRQGDIIVANLYRWEGGMVCVWVGVSGVAEWQGVSDGGGAGW
jgi:hypothetical protein